MTSITIVIPYHNEPRRLDWVLSALEAQLTSWDEVIVVDDHSGTPPPLGRGASWLRLVDVPTTERPGNRSAVRNAGWRACDSDVVVFLDGDMVIGPGFVDNVRHFHAERPRTLLKAARFSLSMAEQGRGKSACLQSVLAGDRWASPAVDILPYAYFSRSWSDGQPPQVCGAADSDEWQGAASNAISVACDLVSEIGGWDEDFNGWGEEDMDFAYRLHLAGARFLYPKPSSHYAVHLDHPLQPGQRQTLARNASRFVSKFSEVLPLRERAYARYGVRIEGDPSPAERAPGATDDHAPAPAERPVNAQ